MHTLSEVGAPARPHAGDEAIVISLESQCFERLGLHWQAACLQSPSASLVNEKAAMLFCWEASEMFLGQQHFTWLSIDMGASR